MKQTLLSSDKGKVTNNYVYKYQCPKLIEKINGVYTEILIDISAELSIINLKCTNIHKKQFKNAMMWLIKNPHSATNIQIVNKPMFVNITKNESNWIIGIDKLHCVKAKIDLFENLLNVILLLKYTNLNRMKLLISET